MQAPVEDAALWPLQPAEIAGPVCRRCRFRLRYSRAIPLLKLPVFSLLLSILILLLAGTGGVAAGVGDKKNLLDELLETYDLDKWPTFQEGEMEAERPEPTKVTISIDIMFISSIDVQAMDLTIDFYLNQRWRDARLAYSESRSKRKIVLRTVEQIKRVWTPDTYMVNAKSANFHDVTTPNRLVYIDHNGDVMYSARITAKLACEMHFAMYPVDTQVCTLHLASYAYPMIYLEYHWRENGSVEYTGTTDLNQFTLANKYTDNKPDKYPDGLYPALQVKFRFQRNFGHHLIQTYLPTVLIVTISWVSFFLEAGAVPARVSLGITTFLTMITLNSGAKVGLPPVSYVKAIDIWMLACTFFVFSTLWHFVLVCVMSRRPMPHSRERTVGLTSGSASASFCAGHTAVGQSLQLSSPHAHLPNARSASTVGSSLPAAHANLLQRRNKSALYQNMSPLSFGQKSVTQYSCSNNKAAVTSPETTATGTYTQTELDQGRNTYSSAPEMGELDYIKERSDSNFSNEPIWVLRAELMAAKAAAAAERSAAERGGHFQRESAADVGVSDEQLSPLEHSPVVSGVLPRRKKFCSPCSCRCACFVAPSNAKDRAKRIDVYARWLYPLVFLLFNIIYWGYYLNLNPVPEAADGDAGGGAPTEPEQ
ncbi:gamma-aminobutyric acid receptor subunit beta-3-like [Paramacrobiotus metropolitanus]|uniref:gamma-aminobutyric acid receptor subunit beta-3-like n=1 Tax=Paramacrobiotus metropolitanus TaxID=2943436 RepID=UPI0024457CB3|nr:gamma-aminobutyric acid receptor subunit beta-3-like [Paramacrobiotus metropolitanus]